MNPKERFNTAFQYLKGAAAFHTQKEAAKKMGASPQNMSSALSGDPKVLTENFIKRFNNAFGNVFNLDWLLTGEGEMLKSQSTHRPFESNATFVDGDNYVEVEFVDLQADAGVLSGSAESQIEDIIVRPIPREYANKTCYVVRVRGNSMYDGTARSIAEGDEVLVVRMNSLEDMRIRSYLYLISSYDGNVIKQITEINKEEGYILCHSYNEAYNDFKISIDEIYHIYQIECITKKAVTLG